MLTFIVHETLAGNGGRLQAFYIANMVFGRDESFDAATDPLVRVQANRLRKAIERYYLTDGVADTMRISVPKGRYAAAFEIASPDTPVGGRSGESLAASPTVAVLPFSTISRDDEQDYFADGITEEITTALARVENFQVTGRHSTQQFKTSLDDVRSIGEKLGVRFIMEGTVQRSANALRVTAQLSDTTSGNQVWADSYSRELSAQDIFEIQDEIAKQVTAKIADAFGVIPRLLEKETRGKRSPDLKSYDALLRFFHYQANLNSKSYEWAKRGLERAVELDPEYAPALAALAELACDNMTLRYKEPYDRLDEAHAYARRAISADPACQLAHYSMAFVGFHRKDRAECLRSAAKVIELNPHAPYYVGVAGWLMALVGDWDEGLEVMRNSISNNPFYPDWFNLAPFQYHFFRGEYEEALASAERMILPGLPWDPASRLAALTRLGRVEEAQAVLQQIGREYPDFPDYAREYVAYYVFSQKDADALYQALRDAGLEAR